MGHPRSGGGECDSRPVNGRFVNRPYCSRPTSGNAADHSLPHREVPTIYKRQARAPSTASGPPPSRREAILRPANGRSKRFFKIAVYSQSEFRSPLPHREYATTRRWRLPSALPSVLVCVANITFTNRPHPRPTNGKTYAFPCQGRWHVIAVTDE